MESVALLVSAWIEICAFGWLTGSGVVALLVSAWIEMKKPKFTSEHLGRTPRECVD